MLYNKPIRQLHFEITNKCNSSCPMCPRNIHGGAINPVLPLSEISLADIKNFCPPELLSDVEHVYFAGAYGDPIMATELLDIITYLKQSAPHLQIGLFTNASAQNEMWWSKLGKLLSGDKDYCIFSIDGLEDTNHTYRRGTSWPKIMSSAKAFIGSGGIALWEFLVFKHNEHQVEEAKSLAKKMGFKRFTEKYTGRFNRNQEKQQTLGWHNAHPVYKTNGEFEYLIEPAQKISSSNKKWSESEIKETFSQHLTFNENGIPLNKLIDEYSAQINPEITCKAREESKLYISATGYAFPCPWLAYHLYRYDETSESYIVKELFNKNVLKDLNIKKNSIDKIINSSVFNSIPERWKENDIEKGKLPTCIGECGKKDCSTGRSLKSQYIFEL